MFPDQGLANVVDRSVLGGSGIPGYDGGLCVQLCQKTGGVGVHRPVEVDSEVAHQDMLFLGSIEIRAGHFPLM